MRTEVGVGGGTGGGVRRGGGGGGGCGLGMDTRRRVGVRVVMWGVGRGAAMDECEDEARV